MCNAMSACRARLRRSSFSEPGGISTALLRACSAKAASLSCSDCVCLKRRRLNMRCSSRSSRRERYDGDLITGESLGHCGDGYHVVTMSEIALQLMLKARGFVLKRLE